jgi:hypothetical protein
MVLMIGSMNEQVINVDQHIFDIEQHFLHQSLKTGGHPRSPISEVTQANCPLPGIVKAVKFCESSFSFIRQNPDVKSSQVKRVCSSNVTNALCDFFHTIFVNVGVVVNEILDNPQSSTLALVF